MLELNRFFTELPIHTTTIFGTFLILATVATIIDLRKPRHKFGRYIDYLLIASHIAATGAMIYWQFFADSYTKGQEWFFVVFNPIPYIVWAIVRNPKKMRRTWAIMSFVPLIFVFARPLIPIFNEMPYIGFLLLAYYTRMIIKLKA